jgi:nucleotide-binding universal stress UspA family protein
LGWRKSRSHSRAYSELRTLTFAVLGQEVSMFKRILVPVDGGASSDGTISASIELALQLGAAITAFVAVTLLPVRVTAAESEEDQAEESARVAIEPDDLLSHFEVCARASGVEFRAHQLEAPQCDQAIQQAAQSCGCDLLVMVALGRGAFGEFLFGSQTKAVLAGCKLPLLILQV